MATGLVWPGGNCGKRKLPGTRWVLLFQRDF